MDAEKILDQVDDLFRKNRGKDAEKLLLESVTAAGKEENEGARLIFLNELIGYYRENCQPEKIRETADQIMAQLKRMGIQGSVAYGTALLNVATGYRACGELEESKALYREAQAIYDRELDSNDMLVASLKNNLSLLLQELGDYEAAKKNQLDALAIAEANGLRYETAVTYTNLANTCLQLGQNKEGGEYAAKAVNIFLQEGMMDSHCAAAMSTLGMCCFREKEYEKAIKQYESALNVLEWCREKNANYDKLEADLEICRKAYAAEKSGNGETEKAAEPEAGDRGETDSSDAGAKDRSGSPDTGLFLAEKYYETFGKMMIQECFPEYAGRIAAGLAGRGSDCFGYDDETSRDHDWGPDFCMWVTDETYEEIGESLQRAYEQLPKEFAGYTRAAHVNARNRRGVIRISDFYRELTGGETYEEIDWRQTADASLAAAVNGVVFRDEEGIFTAFREKLAKGWPEEIRYLKMAESAARFSQAAQYNYPRMLGRGDRLTARLMVWEGLREAMKLQHYIQGKYPPHEKWLVRSLQETEEGRRVAELTEQIADSLHHETAENTQACIERLGAYFAMEMYGAGFISDTESYLDAHSEELVYKASLAAKEREALVEEIARLEFRGFDKVKNEGGRASCQNDWSTFSIMRKSQYLTWNREMLQQYLYDFNREYHRGHNLIEEKYGRMMESTAPEKYEEIRTHFPELSEEKKAIIEHIVGMQVAWMEEFGAQYPALAGNARKIHTSEDTAEDTSYETYLRGELSTYSDKMLELYGRYVVEYARSGRNTAYEIMENSVKMYGYQDVETAEKEITEYESKRV